MGVDAAVGAAAVLCVLGCVWVGADLYSAALAALVLQLALWDGDAAGAGVVCVALSGWQRLRVSGASEFREPLYGAAAAADVRFWLVVLSTIGDDVPRAAGAERGAGERDDAGAV